MDALLQHIAKVVSLTPAEQTTVCSYFTVKYLKKKESLFVEGDLVQTENFVIKGCLKTSSFNEKAEEHIIQFSLENWWVGDLFSFLTRTPTRFRVVALEDTELLQINRERLDALYDAVPAMERYFRILVQNAYLASCRRVEQTIVLPAEERYHDFQQRYPDLEQRIPQYLIAAYLGMTPEF